MKCEICGCELEKNDMDKSPVSSMTIPQITCEKCYEQCTKFNYLNKDI